jgi:hypothetical protein
VRSILTNPKAGQVDLHRGAGMHGDYSTSEEGLSGEEMDWVVFN